MEICIQNLDKFYGEKQALTQVNLTIPMGMFGLLGRNGAGKTTLMRILATLLPKNGGSITMNGIPIDRTKDIRRIVGYLPQEFSLYPNMTVRGALEYLAVLSEIPKEKREKIVPALIAKVNLTEKANVKIKSLSGGMKRRLGIAQAMLHDPKILIVDEPTAGLDPEERIRFRNLLCEVATERIVILSTHIVGDIEATCENVAILNNGKILYQGTTEELTARAFGRVYALEVAREELEAAKEKYTVLGMLAQGKTISLRILSDVRPSQDAVICEPSIEDGYMQCLQGGTL